jgi:hypothetical protein
MSLRGNSPLLALTVPAGQLCEYLGPCPAGLSAALGDYDNPFFFFFLVLTTDQGLAMSRHKGTLGVRGES